MSAEEDALLDAFEDAFRAIDLLCEHDLLQPALVVLYATIDAAAWLNVRGGGDSKRQDFVHWVDTYLLPGSGIHCNALELYGARCGVLHSLTAFSALSRKGVVRTLGYARGNASVDDLQVAAAALGRTDIVGVHVDQLRGALKSGLQRFLDDAAGDHERWTSVRARASRLFANLPNAVMTEALRHLRDRGPS